MTPQCPFMVAFLCGVSSVCERCPASGFRGVCLWAVLSRRPCPVLAVLSGLSGLGCRDSAPSRPSRPVASAVRFTPCVCRAGSALSCPVPPISAVSPVSPAPSGHPSRSVRPFAWAGRTLAAWRAAVAWGGVTESARIRPDVPGIRPDVPRIRPDEVPNHALNHVRSSSVQGSPASSASRMASTASSSSPPPYQCPCG